jgi:hypothetical protein
MEREWVFELNKLILEQTNDLWLIASALVVFQVLVIAYVSSGRSSAHTNRTPVIWALAASAILYTTSLLFGYLAKGAVISAVKGVVNGKQWIFPALAEAMNLCQFAALAIGLLVFVATFVLDPRFLSRAVRQVTQ